MENWTEIKTAYQVASKGTVSAAAAVLGIHRATVIRHIDTLEKILGAKLFLRHLQGYTPTELGLELMRMARVADAQFSQLPELAATENSAMSGEFILTSLPVLAPLLMPVLKKFQLQYPNISVCYLVSKQLLRLETCEAHIAIRAGLKPQTKDYVVQPFIKARIGLYASPDYISRQGIPQSKDDFAQHYFVGFENKNLGPPFELNLWMRENIPQSNIIFRSNDMNILQAAVVSGIGIGFFSNYEASQYPELIEILPQTINMSATFWIVTHIDLYNLSKVKAFLSFLSQEF